MIGRLLERRIADLEDRVALLTLKIGSVCALLDERRVMAQQSAQFWAMRPGGDPDGA